MPRGRPKKQDDLLPDDGAAARGHDDHQLVAEEIDARRYVDRAALLRVIHLHFVRADEEIGRRAVDDLAGEHVGSREIEADRKMAGPLVRRRDLLQGVGQADGGRHQDLCVARPLERGGRQDDEQDRAKEHG
jgi:hypothetical protein